MNNDDRERLSRFETELHDLVKFEREWRDEWRTKLCDHEKRIRHCERNQNIMYGISLTISLFIVGILKKMGIL